MKLRSMLKKSLFLVPFILYFAGMYHHRIQEKQQAVEDQVHENTKQADDELSTDEKTAMPEKLWYFQDIKEQTFSYECPESNIEKNEDKPVEEFTIY